MQNLFPTSGDGHVLLMDGAMATQLQLAGVQPGECFELWNLTQPDCVRSIHQSYVEAGAEVLLTNTFQANPVQLQRHGLLERGAEIGHAATALARSVQTVANGQVRFVLGDIGPMAEEPGGVNFPRPEPLRLMADWLAGVEAILLETCSDWSVWQAVRWLREKVDVPILLSLTFLNDRNGAIRSWDHHCPEEFAQLAGDNQLAGLGVNCGNGQDMARIAEVLQRFRQATDVPLFARPNAGMPVQEDGRWIYPLTPELMAAQLPELLDTGVRMIGGCCGTTPAHIAAIDSVLAESC
jgi:5-methyltetrahydrofolate--homocysteine methyltransferase